MNWVKIFTDLLDFGINQRSKTAAAANLCYVFINIMWAFWAFIHDDWDLADLFLITGVSYVCTLLGLKTVETIQSVKNKKAEAKKEPDPEPNQPQAEQTPGL
jgi:hypothetical protein